MNTNEALELHQLIIKNTAKLQSRKDGMALRKIAIDSITSDKMIKLAFDTRRINQETDYNPRRNLQNYNRSEKFITESQQERIDNFAKIKVILDELKEKYGREPEWNDSYCRVLANTIDQALRIGQNDGDYGDTMPSVGSFDYVEEMLFARYRLEPNNLAKYGDEQLRNIILSKDDALVKKTDIPKFEITKRDVAEKPYDMLLDKLFNGVRATKEHRNVKRSVTITIEDSFIDDDMVK